MKGEMNHALIRNVRKRQTVLPSIMSRMPTANTGISSRRALNRDQERLCSAVSTAAHLQLVVSRDAATASNVIYARQELQNEISSLSTQIVGGCWKASPAQCHAQRNQKPASTALIIGRIVRRIAERYLGIVTRLEEPLGRDVADAPGGRELMQSVKRSCFSWIKPRSINGLNSDLESRTAVRGGGPQGRW